MRSISLLLFAFLLTASLKASDLPVQIEKAWIRSVPPSSEATAAYMTIHNTGNEPLRLISATTSIAGECKPMITTHKNIDGKHVMGMELTPFLEIPAGGKRELAPGGDHLMILKLKSHPKENEKVKLTLLFEPGSKQLTIELPAQKGPAEH